MALSLALVDGQENEAPPSSVSTVEDTEEELELETKEIDIEAEIKLLQQEKEETEQLLRDEQKVAELKAAEAALQQQEEEVEKEIQQDEAKLEQSEQQGNDVLAEVEATATPSNDVTTTLDEDTSTETDAVPDEDSDTVDHETEKNEPGGDKTNGVSPRETPESEDTEGTDQVEVTSGPALETNSNKEDETAQEVGILLDEELSDKNGGDDHNNDDDKEKEREETGDSPEAQDEPADSPTEENTEPAENLTEEEEEPVDSPPEMKEELGDSQKLGGEEEKTADSPAEEEETVEESDLDQKIDGEITETHNEAHNVLGGPLKACSDKGMALTGSIDPGFCVFDGYQQQHHDTICIAIHESTLPGWMYGDYDFCEITKQIDPNWCDEMHPCHDDIQQSCPVQNWCVSEVNFADFIESAGGCDKVGSLDCEATNEVVITHFEDIVHREEDKGMKFEIALACLKKRCGQSIHF